MSTGLIRPPAHLLYTMLSPAETGNDTRDELLYGQARAAADTWDGKVTREALFVNKLHERFPQFEIHDLSPIMDAMRLIKSAKEIDLIRKSTQMAGLGIIEAMGSTQSVVYEYQLDAAAKYGFHLQVRVAMVMLLLLVGERMLTWGITFIKRMC